MKLESPYESFAQYMEYWLESETIHRRAWLENREYGPSGHYPHPYTLQDSAVFRHPEDSMAFHKHYRYSTLVYHEHTFLEIIWVFRGECENYVSSVPVHMRQGDICLIPPGVAHYLHDVHSALVCNILVRQSDLQDVFRTVFALDTDLTRFLSCCLPHSVTVFPYMHIQTGDDPVARQLLTEISEELILEKPYHQSMAMQKLPVLFLHLLRNGKTELHLPPSSTRESARLLNHILIYLYQHIRDASLTELADSLQYSVPYICRIIKKQTDSTFIRMLTDFRMHRAADLLYTTDLHIYTIAEQCGYTCIEHFYRIFRKRYHCSPQQYRKRYRALPPSP